MPVRKIPKNYLLVTGAFSSAKNGKSLGYESLLERDMMILLEFDDTVKSFEEQPVRIPYQDNGKARKPYVPDILVHYFPSKTGETPRPELIEVKHTSDLKKHKAKYTPKFAAAKTFAEERGWEWRILTEKEIRTPYLDNLKFLREYSNAKPDEALVNEVVNYVRSIRGGVTVESVFEKLCPTEDRTLAIAPAIWYLVAIKRISTNLKIILSSKSKLSFVEEVRP